MKALFNYKSGKQRGMTTREALILEKLGHGYMVRDMATQPMVAPEIKVDLDSMSREALHALAKERGVKVHHMAGAEKVRAALR
jgi:hypothetical protein